MWSMGYNQSSPDYPQKKLYFMLVFFSCSYELASLYGKLLHLGILLIENYNFREQKSVISAKMEKKNKYWFCFWKASHLNYLKWGIFVNIVIFLMLKTWIAELVSYTFHFGSKQKSIYFGFFLPYTTKKKINSENSSTAVIPDSVQCKRNDRLNVTSYDERQNFIPASTKLALYYKWSLML